MGACGLDPQQLTKYCAGVAAALIAFGLVVQDWSCLASCTAAVTAGPGDTSMGTYVTYYALAAMSGFMVFQPPQGGDLIRRAFQGSFACAAAGWLLYGLLHQVFSAAGDLHDYLFIGAVSFLAFAGVWHVFVALMAAQTAGYIKQFLQEKKMAYIFVGISAAFEVLLYLHYKKSMDFPEWVWGLASQGTFCLLLCVFGAFAEEMRWALATLASYGLVAFLNVEAVNPFAASQRFNDNALRNCILMFYSCAVFGLLTAMCAKAANVFSKLESSAEKMVHSMENGGRRCCTCSWK